MKTVDIAWMGGLLEGEGWFGLTSKKAKSGERQYPIIGLAMTDRDTVARAANLFGNCVGKASREKRNPKCKQQWTCHIVGTRAVSWMFMLWPFLGLRRQQRVREVVAHWKTIPPSKSPKGMRWYATCHPERFSIANGLCQTCYMRVYRKSGSLIKKQDRISELAIKYGLRRDTLLQRLKWGWSEEKALEPVRTLHPATCHPEKRMRAKGLCFSCYMKQWHAVNGKQKTIT